MALFKYCNENGKFILQNLEIKVTPPNELNDPCEMRPVVKTANPHAWACEKVRKVVSRAEYYNNHILDFPKCKNFTQFQKYARSNLAVMIQLLERNAPDLDFSLQGQVLAMVSKKWGIISLSAEPLIPLMWSHYANSHRGLLVEFNDRSPLFTSPSFLKCEYIDSPAVYDPSQGLNHKAVEAFASRKKTDWAYEKESRLIIALRDCNKVDAVTPPMYLFALDAAVIVSVTFGLHSTPALRREVQLALQKPALSHVSKWKIVEGAVPGSFQRAPAP